MNKTFLSCYEFINAAVNEKIEMFTDIIKEKKYSFSPVFLLFFDRLSKVDPKTL